MDAIKLGQIISENRRHLGLTQKELGQRLAVSEEIIFNWERGLSCPDTSLMNRLAAELRISFPDLLGEQPSDIIQSSNTAEHITAENTPFASSFRLTLNKFPGAEVSPHMLGMNLEHTRSSITTGLSAQMLKNRKFAGKPSACRGNLSPFLFRTPAIASAPPSIRQIR